MKENFDLSNVDAGEILDLVNKWMDGSDVVFSINHVNNVLDGDWPNADEHQEWLDSASVEEIADWVYCILINTID
jgi:hypothetical protein